MTPLEISKPDQRIGSDLRSPDTEYGHLLQKTTQCDGTLRIILGRETRNGIVKKNSAEIYATTLLGLDILWPRQRREAWNRRKAIENVLDIYLIVCKKSNSLYCQPPPP